MTGNDLPKIVTELVGPKSRAWIDRLAERECPAITSRRARRASALGVSDTDPIVWDSALGANVTDVDGNKFVDMTAGFGVASVGHRNPAVVRAGQEQLAKLPHAMGDAFPDPRRIELLERLAEKTGLDRGIFGCSGSDAVDAALKTARIATGRDKVLAFRNSYHGLASGSLPVTDYKSKQFRGPFEGQLGHHVTHVDIGSIPEDLNQYGAVIVEPIQGRGGMTTPPKGWLKSLSNACKTAGTALIFDEIYTGFGRTGDWFAMKYEEVTPDLLCLGKGMAGGFPISVVMGSSAIMDAWGASTGEALHTQTFLGNPVGCAMGLATIQEIEDQNLIETSAETGKWLREELSKYGSVRGRGLMLGLEVENSLSLYKELLNHGYIALPAGPNAEVIAVVPPLNIHRRQLVGFIETLSELI
jgi:4-aminobutyrate aminotransferase/(S)-3-amino-2-methylpropionate transaminase